MLMCYARVQAGVFVDNSQSGGATNTSTLGGPVILPPNGLPAINLQLHMLIDRSMLEVRFNFHLLLHCSLRQS